MSRKRKVRPKPAPYSLARDRASAYRRWRRAFKHLRGDIITLAEDRHIYREIRTMIEANPALHVQSLFYDWIQRAYVSHITLTIRRLVDWRKRSISLIKLMQEIEDHPEVITRRRFVATYPKFMKSLAHRDFERFAKPGASRIDPKVTRAQRRELIVAQRRLRELVNRHIAHWTCPGFVDTWVRLPVLRVCAAARTPGD